MFLKWQEIVLIGVECTCPTGCTPALLYSPLLTIQVFDMVAQHFYRVAFGKYRPMLF